MKKIISIVLCTMISLASMVAVAADSDIKVQLNGTLLSFDVPPQIIEGRTMVPLRVIFEGLGANVEWNETEKKITSTKDDLTVILTINSEKMLVNGEEIILDSPACIIDGRTLVPVRAVAEAYGANVDWIQDTREVIIHTKDYTAPEQVSYADMTEKYNQVNEMINGGMYLEVVAECDTILTEYTISPEDKTVFEGLKSTAEGKYNEYIASLPLTIDQVITAPVDSLSEWNRIVGGNDMHAYYKKNFRILRNSVDGIYLCWGALNKSSKPIKYLTFTAELLNQVDDPAYDSITGDSSVTIKLVGPLQPNCGFAYRKLIAYSSSCSKIRIGNVSVEFMDGSVAEGYYGYTTEMESEYSKHDELCVMN